MVVMLIVNAMGLLRISPEGEMHGLDLHEHGISAYPEYVIASIGRPSGMAPEPAASHGVSSLAASPKTT
jgi:Amt family ammonium transporter